MITHGACGKQWSGGRAAHCGCCHETFSGTTAFEEHWRAAPDGACRSPEDVGLVAVMKPYGPLWSWPGRRPTSEL